MFAKPYSYTFLSNFNFKENFGERTNTVYESTQFCFRKNWLCFRFFCYQQFVFSPEASLLEIFLDFFFSHAASFRYKLLEMLCKKCVNVTFASKMRNSCQHLLLSNRCYFIERNFFEMEFFSFRQLSHDIFTNLNTLVIFD